MIKILKKYLNGLKSFVQFKIYRYINSKKFASSNSLYYKNKIENNYIFQELIEKGYVVLNNFVQKNTCDNLMKIVDDFIDKNPEHIWIDENKSDHRIHGAENISNKINNLELNSFSKKIGSTYLKQDLELLMIMINKTIFKSKNIGSGGGWHKDSHANQFKSILYLNDVDSENGPFELIRNTNKDYINFKLFTKLNKIFPNTRFSDDDVKKIIEKNKFKVERITGKAGTLILVNTSLIHRGSPLKGGIRYAMTSYLYPKKKISEYKDHFPKRIINKLF